MSCEECDEQHYVIDKLAKLLAEIAIIVNGPEPPLTRWSYHDLPQKVRALKQAPPAAAVKNRDPNRSGLASQCFDSAQLSTLPSWCRELLESAADALCEAPPAAVVPAPMKHSTLDDVRGGKFYADEYVDGWNACRAAMLAAQAKEDSHV